MGYNEYKRQEYHGQYIRMGSGATSFWTFPFPKIPKHMITLEDLAWHLPSVPSCRVNQSGFSSPMICGRQVDPREACKQKLAVSIRGGDVPIMPSDGEMFSNV